MDDFRLLSEGMSYARVSGIFGRQGREFSSLFADGVQTDMYFWQNPGGCNVVVTFQNDRLVAKAQAGSR